MSETLAGGTNELAMTNVLKKFGAQVTNDLFPDYPYHEDPIIPVGTKWNFKPCQYPHRLPPLKRMVAGRYENKEKVEGIGSNNWANSGSKTAVATLFWLTTRILTLRFPSIWYQMQIGPGVNVYRGFLPGAPCVVIGYNQNISWGETNVDADMLDWYHMKFKDNKPQRILVQQQVEQTRT
jgi:penicillin amidase